MQQERKHILGGMIGNVLEWYDFAVYGYFATILSKQFFPDSDPTTGLIATFGIFAAGFLMRPLGGLMFGLIGDKYGRKRALYLSIMMMAIPSLSIGLLPTYATAGIWAAVLLALLRLIQGLSVGGELTTSITYMIETAPNDKRGLMGSWTTFGAVGGILLGSLVGMAITGILTEDQVHQFGWRIPFLMGSTIGMAGLIMRRGIEEEEAPAQHQSPGDILRHFFNEDLRKSIRVILGLWCFATAFYMLFVYFPSYMHVHVDQFKLDDALTINTINMAVLLGLTLLMGWLSDRWGRKRMLLIALAVLMIGSPLLFYGFESGVFMTVFWSQMIFAVMISVMQGTVPALLAEQFDRKSRLTSLSISYNIALALFGGTTPMLCSWLIKEFDGNALMPGYYLAVSALISFIFILFFESRLGKDLL